MAQKDEMDGRGCTFWIAMGLIGYGLGVKYGPAVACIAIGTFMLVLVVTSLVMDP